MSKPNRPRSRGNLDDDENLRGSNRQLRKEVDQWKRYAKHLEKKIRRYEANFDAAEEEQDSTAVPEVKSSPKNPEGRKCKSDKCRSTNLAKLDVKKFNDPITIWICQDCGSRETVKS